MKRFAWVLGGLALLAVAAWMTDPAGAQDGKNPTIKEIMGKLHKGANAPVAVLKKDLQADAPNWEEIQKTSKEFVTLGTALGKNDPPKGEKDSWSKLTTQYLESAKSLDEAARKKDPKAALAAQGKLAGSCTACHKTHRPN